MSIVSDSTAIAAAVVFVGAAVAINVVLLVGLHLRAHRRLCVDVACRRPQWATSTLTAFSTTPKEFESQSQSQSELES